MAHLRKRLVFQRSGPIKAIPEWLVSDSSPKSLVILTKRLYIQASQINQNTQSTAVLLMSIVQFFGLAAISFATACGFAFVESESLRRNAYDWILAAQHSEEDSTFLTFKGELEPLPNGSSRPEQQKSIPDTPNLPHASNAPTAVPVDAVESDHPTAQRLLKELREIEQLLTAMRLQELRMTRSRSENDIDLQYTREEIGVLESELTEFRIKLTNWRQTRIEEKRAHLRKALPHLREAGLTQLVETLSGQLTANETARRSE